MPIVGKAMSSAKPKLLIATRNPGKMLEYRELLQDTPYQLVSLDDLGVTGDVDETGETFRDNAVLKATSYAAMGGLLALADDSGLAVDALGGDPGVRSARYGEKSPQPPFTKGGTIEEFAKEGSPGISPTALTEKMSDQDRVQLLLRNLERIPWEQRTARFRCVICIAGPNAESAGDPVCSEGAVAGMIQYQPKGDQGFGYDPIFFLPSYSLTMAQLSLEEKNRISHRADAARKAVETLKNLNVGG